MTIDPVGQRANDTGWTREALKAERKAKKRAESRAFWAGVAGGLWAIWVFLLGNVVLWLAVSGVVAIGGWEWINTARGWHNLYPGLPDWAPPAGALGAIVLYFHAFREMRQHFRKADEARHAEPRDETALRKHRGEGLIWLSVTAAAYLVCVAGVFIATATAAQKATRIAEDSRKAYLALQIDRDNLKRKVELNSPDYLAMSLTSAQRTLEALTESARVTHGAPDLDMGSGCPAPPRKFTLERLCVQANGGIDPFSGEVMDGLRMEIQRAKKRLADAEADAQALAKLQAEIDNFRIAEGDETAEALGDMLSVEGGTALSWLLFVLSSLFLYGGGWLNDWVVDRIMTIVRRGRTHREA